MLLSSKGIANIVRNRIGKLYKNAFYMYNLINELLDFHKLEQKQIRLKVCFCNIVPFLNDIYLSFKEKAVTQEVNYKFVVYGDVILCWFDAVQLRKVFFNLLSNAFKYTKKGGTVEVLVSDDDDECIIRIVDTGVGIAKEDVEQIFERFYQTTVGRDIIGSGIGLALSKEIVELHHGEISVESKVGYGSIFIVRLKKRKECLCNDPKIEITEVQEPLLEETEIKEEVLRLDSEVGLYLDEEGMAGMVQESCEGNEEKDKYTILIVEDDKELLVVLDELFSSLYYVLKAQNGKDGWDIVQKEHPDIILSDVMMPEMGGLEMCMKIKNDMQTCHIPVILLTAASSSEQQIEGLKTGADDYLAKPFNSKILLLKVGTILRSRNLLKGMLSEGVKTNFGLLAKNEQERQMIQKIENIVEKHLEDVEFDTDKLGKELGMSRSSTFKKIKALTGITPSDFILGYRLKKAAALLLEHSEFQMEDIASQLGFSSGRYFSKCFKKYYNVSPLQYRKRHIVDS
jgi:DNA-binding response OmpR family regulator/anti-sigma regulatory factor (Ser/Thr protein kinase)